MFTSSFLDYLTIHRGYKEDLRRVYGGLEQKKANRRKKSNVNYCFLNATYSPKA